MKKVLFLIFMISVIATLSLCAYAEVIEVGASSAEDITGAISSAATGDSVRVKLKADLEFGTSIVIDKAISVEVLFDGYQIRYTGTSGKKTSVAAFTVKNAGATLSLVGSNFLSYAPSYTHYGEEKKADMVGTGNLIGVTHGSVKIKNAYLYANNDTFVFYVDLVRASDAVVSVDSSVLRTKNSSDIGAIAYCGGSSGNDNIVKKQLFLNNTVEYGGFKGIPCAFNVTRGSEFTNVKFYDFAIVNDSWHSISSIYANSFEDAILFKGCTFNTYGEVLDAVSVQTETGKHNIKLWNCKFTEVINGGKFSGDSGGTAHVFVVEKAPSCTEDGSAYSYSSPKGNANTKPMSEYKKDSFTVAKAGHSGGAREELVYKNGFAMAGCGVLRCATCGIDYETGKIYAPIFEELGASVNQGGTSIVFAVRINKEAYKEYKLAKERALDFGIFVGNKSATLTVSNGELVATGGYFSSMRSEEFDLVDMKISGFNEKTSSVPFVAEFYAFDGERVTFIKEDFEAAVPASVKDYIEKLDEVNKAAEALLKSKHKLYFNDDGTFRVLTIADMHMSLGADSTKVEERIRMLVDREKPNLVVFTGDNVVGVRNAEGLRTCLDRLVGYIEENKIPWCHVYGNHDREGGMSNLAQQTVYESYEYCISKDEGAELVSGVGNYVHGIYNKDGTLGAVIYFLDSGTSDSQYVYDYIEEDQIAWYKETSVILERYNGSSLRGIMAFHIPLIENQYAYENSGNKEIVSESEGVRYEAICPSTYDTNLFETILERGDVKAIVTGHDHSNDYMYNYYGVKLCSAPSFSALGYTKSPAQEGARVFEFTKGGIDTYVSYIIERVNPDDYGVYDKDVSINSFIDENTKVTTSGFDGGRLEGTFTAEYVDGKISLVRSSRGNSELRIAFDKTGYGKLGGNKYLVVKVDFSLVDFRKACFGLLSSDGEVSYRTDDFDSASVFYYLATGESEWVKLSHGNDGCFGTDQASSMKGKAGYLALPVQYFRQGSRSMTNDTLVTGIYFYCDVNSGNGEEFYISDFMLVEDYTTVK